MKINTRYFGEMETSDEEIITLSHGLFGFEDQTEYVLIRFDAEDDTLLCLQSIKEADLAFVVVNPFRILLTYAPKLTKKELHELEAASETDLNYYAIAVIHEDFKDTTVNLRCPIALNVDTRRGRQVILEDSAYSMRHPAVSESKEESC